MKPKTKPIRARKMWTYRPDLESRLASIGCMPIKTGLHEYPVLVLPDDAASRATLFENYVAQIHALRGLIKAHDRPILGVALQTAAPKDEFLLLPRHMGPM